MNVTREQVLEVIARAGVSVDVGAIQGNISLSKAGIDSLEMMNVFLAIEENFNIKLSDEDTEKLNTLDDIIAYLQGL
jgi:acyl carrier protein